MGDWGLASPARKHLTILFDYACVLQLEILWPPLWLAQDKSMSYLCPDKPPSTLPTPDPNPDLLEQSYHPGLLPCAQYPAGSGYLS